jgi:ABC-2 type transport system ATP-binding protein
MSAVHLHGVSKYFGTQPGVVDATMAVDSGAVVGLLGPNGAGKTTLLNVVAAQVRPCAGTVMLLGQPVSVDPIAAKRFVGFAPDDQDLPDYLTGREYLSFVAAVRAIDEQHAAAAVTTWLDHFHLTADADRLIKGYSHGMRKKTILAAALLHTPLVVIVDEPTNGLDPLSIRHLRITLRACADQGAAVLVATHDLHFATQLCDYLYLVARHQIAAHGRVDQLLQKHECSNLEEVYSRIVQAY